MYLLVLPAVAIVAGTVFGVGTARAQTADWQPVPWVTAEMREAGIDPGGEGGQWPRALAMDQVDGQFMMWGTDVGGLYRSLDGGQRWEPCNVGYTPRGTADIAIDPHNPDRLLAVGANSGANDVHGLYLSTDRAASWEHVLPLHMSGAFDRRNQIAYDPLTYDAELGYTTDIYWSRIAHDRAKWGEVESDPSLYKSTDGGVTWQRLAETEHLGGGLVVVHPVRQAVVFIANHNGLYVSEDGGETSRKLYEGELTGLAVTPAEPESLWISDARQVLQSTDGGETWAPLGVPSIVEEGHSLNTLCVSPASARHLLIDSTQDGVWGRARRFASHDGGQTWPEAAFDNTLAFLPHNRRNASFALHPMDPEIVFSTGGGWPTLSDDGGLTYRWSGSGVNAVMVGGMMHFNVHDPNVLFVSSQDHNGAVTRDGGRTWERCNVSGYSWGGFTYGGYAISSDRLIAGKAASWGGERVLRMSTDGGQSFADVADVRWSSSSNARSSEFGYNTSMGDPADRDVAFAAGFRTADGGETWERMEDCHGVFAVSPTTPYRLFGLRRDQDADVTYVVASDDHGRSWQTLFHREGGIRDIAFDPSRERIYAAADDELLVYEHGGVSTITVPADGLGNRRVTSVAVDPVDPDVVYVAQHQNRYAADNSLSRSTDGGQTWTVLTRREPLEPGVLDGGREARTVRVHPVTREAWTTGACYGIWKVAPPSAGDDSDRH